MEVKPNEATIVSLHRYSFKGGPPSLANPSAIDINQIDARMSDDTVGELFIHRSGSQLPKEAMKRMSVP